MRFFKFIGTPPVENWIWLVCRTFEDRGILGNREPRPIDLYLKPLDDSDIWSSMLRVERDNYQEISSDQVPDEILNLAEKRVNECFYMFE